MRLHTRMYNKKKQRFDDDDHQQQQQQQQLPPTPPPTRKQVYYELCDTAINHWLIEQGGLDVAGDSRYLIVHSSCDFFNPIKYPSMIHVGIRVAKLGRTSIRWEIGIFDGSEYVYPTRAHAHAHTRRHRLRPRHAHTHTQAHIAPGPEIAALGKMVHVHVNKTLGDRPAPIAPATRTKITEQL